MSIWNDKDGITHVSIMVGGQRVHRRMPRGAPASAAKLLEAELRGAVTHRRTPSIPHDPALVDLMGMYLVHCDTLRSPATAKHHALRIGRWLAGKRASQARQVASHIARDMAGHYAPATINRSLGALKKALRIAWERDLTSVDWSAHVKRLPEHNARDTHLDIHQVKAIADHASEAVRAAIWIALLTGCRRGEVLAIKPDDIGADTITIRAGNTKTLKTRTIPIIPAVRPWLAHVPIPINFEGLKTGFRRAREAAGMPDVNFHDLRHSCASILLASGADLYTVAKVLGHSSIKTTERYSHMQIDQQRAALQKAFG